MRVQYCNTTILTLTQAFLWITFLVSIGKTQNSFTKSPCINKVCTKTWIWWYPFSCDNRDKEKLQRVCNQFQQQLYNKLAHVGVGMSAIHHEPKETVWFRVKHFGIPGGTHPLHRKGGNPSWKVCLRKIRGVIPIVCNTRFLIITRLSVEVYPNTSF